MGEPDLVEPQKMDRTIEEFRRWFTAFEEQARTGRYPRWPNEIMLKLLFGRYLATPLALPERGRVLDIGCGFANNLRPFLERGWEACGVEVLPEVAQLIADTLGKKGIAVDVRAGTNRSIPFPDRHFDLLLSVNTIHYEPAQADMDAALDEFHRVLKPGGAAFLVTVGPKHDIFTRSKPLGPFLHQVRDWDFRDGKTMFFFQSEKMLEAFLGRRFTGIETGQVTEKLMSRQLDFLVAVARRGLAT